MLGHKFYLGAVSAAAISLLTSVSAYADGMPERYVASSRPAPVYNWSGIYAGGGLGWIRSDIDLAFNPAITGAAHQAYSMESDKWVAGLHAGFQHQFGGIVLGIEGAILSDGGKASDP